MAFSYSNNNLSKCVKINPEGVKSATISNGYPEGRYFDISVEQLNGESTALFSVTKDTVDVVTYENNIWTNRYSLATKSDLWPQNSGTEITANTDMQTITTPGHYYCGNNNTVVSLKNCPISDAFILVVYRATGGTGDNNFYIAQEYTSYLCNRRVIQTYNKDSKKWTTREIQFKS